MVIGSIKWLHGHEVLGTVCGKSLCWVSSAAVLQDACARRKV